jgi:predicted glycosyltransferase
LPHTQGVEVRGYVPALYKHLAACDLALVQGGLSTTMELVATRRPFLYFPLGRHFEQAFHVPHGLPNYGVRPTARVDYATSTPERLADRIVSALRDVPAYRPVETTRKLECLGENISALTVELTPKDLCDID